MNILKITSDESVDVQKLIEALSLNVKGIEIRHGDKFSYEIELSKYMGCVKGAIHMDENGIEQIKFYKK